MPIEARPSEPRIPQRSPRQRELLARALSQSTKKQEEYFAEWDAWAEQPDQVSDENRKEAVEQLKAWFKAAQPNMPLNLSRLNLTGLPENLSTLTSLQKLDLSSNWLTDLPESLSNLTSLQELNISHNRMISLPENLSDLTSLQELNASSNLLKSLPHLATLTSLQKLDVSHNQLKSLPRLANLTSLWHLNVSYNQLPNLRTLPAKLGYLYANNNQIASVQNLPPDKLVTINLSSNQLKRISLPKDFFTLMVERNSKLRQRDRFCAYGQLQRLHLENNPLRPQLIEILSDIVNNPPYIDEGGGTGG